LFKKKNGMEGSPTAELVEGAWGGRKEVLKKKSPGTDDRGDQNPKRGGGRAKRKMPGAADIKKTQTKKRLFIALKEPK